VRFILWFSISVEPDRIRNSQGIAEVAEPDEDELGHLLGKVAEAKRIDQADADFMGLDTQGQ
jgi:hypothetical protein